MMSDRELLWRGILSALAGTAILGGIMAVVWLALTRGV